MPRRAEVIWAAAGVVALLGTWQLLTGTLGLIAPLTLPSPLDVAREMVRLAVTSYDGTTLAQNVAVSLEAVFTGWLVGVVLGVPLGVAMGWSPKVRDYLHPIVEILRPMPPPAWIPFAVLWFGISLGGRVFVIAVAALMPCIINSYGAVRACDPIFVDAARCLGARNNRIVATIVVPTMASEIIAGIRIALGNAWMTVVAAELVASSAGLGFILVQAQYALQPSVVLVSMVIIGTIGALLALAIGSFERKIGKWQ